MALAHKGLDFERVPTPFTSVPAVEGGVSKTVPVIRDGDKVVADSFDDRALSRRRLSRPPDAVRRRRRQGDGALHRALVAADHPSVSRRGGADSTSTHRLAPPDQAYFRESREKRYGKTLEEVAAGRDAGLAAFRASLEPLRSMLAYQPFIGGRSPLFADYIVFGAFQWVRVMSPYRSRGRGDPVRRVVRALPRPA